MENDTEIIAGNIFLFENYLKNFKNKKYFDFMKEFSQNTIVLINFKKKFNFIFLDFFQIY